MDISNVLVPAVSPVPKGRVGEAPSGASALEKPLAADDEAATELVNSVVSQSQEIPGEKLSSHLGRNVDVTA